MAVFDPTARFAPCTVLAVDDDPVTRELLQSLLNNSNIPTIACSGGQEMWHILAHITPQLILLDVEMPGQDGFTLLEELRQRYGLQVIIIMLTSHAGTVDFATGMDCGADDYLTKPCDFSTLLQTVQKYL